MKTHDFPSGLRIIDARMDIRAYASEHKNPAAKAWSRRPLSAINRLVVHHQGGGRVTAASNAWNLIREDALYHMQKNWGTSARPYYAPSIAYHYVISYEGYVYWLNDRGETTWHAMGANPSSIGIELQGNFTLKDEQEKPCEPTTAQLRSLALLLDYLTEWTEDGAKAIPATKENVWGHGELTQFGNRTACPGTALPYVQEYRRTGRIQKAGIALPPEVPTGFSDLDAEAWYFPFAQACIDAGIMRGYEYGTWRPEASISRAEMAKVAVGIALHSERLVEAYKSSTS